METLDVLQVWERHQPEEAVSGGDVKEVEGVLGVQDRGGFGVAALVVRSPGFKLRTLTSREGGISKLIENYKLLTSDDKSTTTQDTAPGT